MLPGLFGKLHTVVAHSQSTGHPFPSHQAPGLRVMISREIHLSTLWIARREVIKIQVIYAT